MIGKAFHRLLLLGLSATFLVAGCAPSIPKGVHFTSTITDGPKNLIIKFIEAARGGQAKDIAELAYSGARAEQEIKAAELLNKHRLAFKGDIDISATTGENNGMVTACLHLKMTENFIKAHINGTGSMEGVGSREIWTMDWFEIRNTSCVGQR